MPDRDHKYTYIDESKVNANIDIKPTCNESILQLIKFDCFHVRVFRPDDMQDMFNMW